MTLSDGFGRTFRYLRLSITEACNFRCSYCLPDGYKKRPGPAPLSRVELRRAATAFSELGLTKIRLTGGEPTLRKDFEQIAADISALQQVRTLALTTNGYRLEKRAHLWRAAGINALNISLDSLDRERFRQITGHDRRDEVLRGIDAAFEAGFETIKINVVYMKGLNDHEVGDFINLTRERPLSVRFIELMETGEHAAFFTRHHIPADTIARKLYQQGWTPKLKAADAGPANNFIHPDHRGSIGLIAPYSKDFCQSCNRLRFSSFGNLHLCLFGNFGLPLRRYLQHDEQIGDLKQQLIKAVRRKTAGHQLAQHQTGMTGNLSAIGG
ncbi:GTP 3',8-cyclase MoaA [Luteithermobacter gelatinilyticus]|uniref:GTP 3',8-cyclase MoaA n=1 Tax=Luteithermobacter gelatinilyticus TaxID=2582913 RepID=UPI001106740C|nr:GTP 3',8-cyclase MoaA [Luteithermobacter gelatinilyticus]